MGQPFRRSRLAACAVAAGALMTALVPATGATAATPAGAPRAVAADDPVPGHEGMPDDGFEDAPEGEQDDLAGSGTGSAPSATADAQAVVPGRPGDFTLETGTGREA
nr:hypothetical protein [Streptomyces sp. QL37]PPQ58471.1 hypothetical protein C5F59_18650 [Streptomyces sp. QL37]